MADKISLRIYQSIVRISIGKTIRQLFARQVTGAVRLLKKSGSLANRSTSALPRGVGCQHDILPTTNQPPVVQELLLRIRDDTAKGSARE